jgi:hypothetical protein
MRKKIQLLIGLPLLALVALTLFNALKIDSASAGWL